MENAVRPYAAMGTALLEHNGASDGRRRTRQRYEA